MALFNEWPGTLSREDAIKIFDRATDRDDPFWENIVEEFHDEDSDTVPSIFHVFEALGVSRDEYKILSGIDGGTS